MGVFLMNEEMIKELDNDSLMEFLYELENLEKECNEIIEGESHE